MVVSVVRAICHAVMEFGKQIGALLYKTRALSSLRCRLGSGRLADRLDGLHIVIHQVCGDFTD